MVTRKSALQIRQSSLVLNLFLKGSYLKNKALFVFISPLSFPKKQ
jgi:hypothetical protein